jgi:hypothetical protein
MKIWCDLKDSNIICDILNRDFNFNYKIITFVEKKIISVLKNPKMDNSEFFEIIGYEYSIVNKTITESLFIYDKDPMYNEINNWYLSKIREDKLKKIGLF